MRKKTNRRRRYLTERNILFCHKAKIAMKRLKDILKNKDTLTRDSANIVIAVRDIADKTKDEHPASNAR